MASSLFLDYPAMAAVGHVWGVSVSAGRWNKSSE